MTPEVIYESRRSDGKALELKCCEFCPRNFLRPVGSQAKYCRRCTVAIVIAERKAQEAPEEHLEGERRRAHRKGKPWERNEDRIIEASAKVH